MLAFHVSMLWMHSWQTLDIPIEVVTLICGYKMGEITNWDFCSQVSQILSRQLRQGHINWIQYRRRTVNRKARLRLRMMTWIWCNDLSLCEPPLPCKQRPMQFHCTRGCGPMNMADKPIAVSRLGMRKRTWLLQATSKPGSIHYQISKVSLHRAWESFGYSPRGENFAASSSQEDYMQTIRLNSWSMDFERLTWEEDWSVHQQRTVKLCYRRSKMLGSMWSKEPVLRWAAALLEDNRGYMAHS